MNTNVIITVKAGEVPSREFIEHALKNCPSCFGVTIQNEDGEDSSLEFAAECKNISVDKLMETLEACKDVRVVLTLGNLVGDFDAVDDLQPFKFQQAVEGEDPKDILHIFLEGDAPEYTKTGEGHTEMYNLWEDFVFPTLLEKFEASSDLDKFYSKLETSAFQQSILHCFSHRGVAVFVPLVGDPIAYGKNELGAEYAWGTTSNTFGWGDAVKKPVIGAVTKAKSKLAGLLGSSATPKETPKEKEDPKEEKTKVDDKGVHHIIDKSNTGMTRVKPPAKLQGNARNAWIRLMTEQYEGPMPAGSASKDYTVEVPDNILPFAMEDLSTKDQVRQLTKRVKAARAGATMEKAHEQIQDPKVTEKPSTPAEKPAEKTPAQEEKRPASDFLPDLSAEAKKGSVDLVTDWATRPTEKMPTAMEILSRESKWPAFTAMMGIQSSDMLNWQIADIKELSKKYPDAMALAFLEMKSIAIANGAFKDHLDSLGKKPEVKETKETKTSDAQASTPTKKKSRLELLQGKAA